MSVRFLPAGDLAVLIEFDEEISVNVNMRVRALEFLIYQKGLLGVVETVPTFRSLLVYYDPRAVGYDVLCASIAKLMPQATTAVLLPALRGGHALRDRRARRGDALPDSRRARPRPLGSRSQAAAQGSTGYTATIGPSPRSVTSLFPLVTRHFVTATSIRGDESW